MSNSVHVSQVFIGTRYNIPATFIWDIPVPLQIPLFPLGINRLEAGELSVAEEGNKLMFS